MCIINTVVEIELSMVLLLKDQKLAWSFCSVLARLFCVYYVYCLLACHAKYGPPKISSARNKFSCKIGTPLGKFGPP